MPSLRPGCGSTHGSHFGKKKTAYNATEIRKFSRRCFRLRRCSASACCLSQKKLVDEEVPRQPASESKIKTDWTSAFVLRCLQKYVLRYTRSHSTLLTSSEDPVMPQPIEVKGQAKQQRLADLHGQTATRSGLPACHECGGDGLRSRTRRPPAPVQWAGGDWRHPASRAKHASRTTGLVAPVAPE